MKTIFVLIVMGMLSGCAISSKVVRSETRDGKKRGSFLYPYAATHFHQETQDQYYKDQVSGVAERHCNGKMKVIGESYDAAHGKLIDFECE